MAELAEKLMSVPDYLALEERSDQKHEYLGGVVYGMAGASIRHNDIATSVLGQLFGQLQGQSCRPMNSDVKVRIRYPDHERFYYPDAGVVCQSNPPTESFQDFPVVLVEVLSPSTRRADEMEKREAYFTIPTLESYLLVDSERMAVTLYTRTERGFERQDFSSPEDELVLGGALKLKVTLAELYERVEFEE